MASYTAAYCYVVNMSGSAFTIRALTSTNVVCTDGETDTVFDAADAITVAGERLPSGEAATFIGIADNGWLGLLAGQYYFFTDDYYRPAEPVAWTSGAFPVCFLAGTMIATPTGEAAVEHLSIGDLVLTAGGRVAPVQWVGVQSVMRRFTDPFHAFPIRVTAGALGGGLPVRDLELSPDHALFFEGVLVQAGALVNGTTIVRETAMPERFTYYHVELADHSLILAEGVPAETFLDTVTRRRFDNYTEYEALYGQVAATIAEMDAPRVKSARQLPASLRRRLQAAGRRRAA